MPMLIQTQNVHRTILIGRKSYQKETKSSPKVLNTKQKKSHKQKASAIANRCFDK